ncbi:MAG TPA: hypothetical protein ENH94_12115 [Phycisphaerales bacterium]|nr:hypothetical protein [Phycisphaerales bacterium]
MLGEMIGYAPIHEKDLPVDARIRLTTFSLTEAKYGLKVKVIGCMELKDAPFLPDCVRGTIDLAGKSIPVIDSPARTGNHPRKITSDACIVVSKDSPDAPTYTSGVIYEDISEVLDLIKGKL